MQSAHMCRYAQGIFAIMQHSVDTAQASATLPFTTGLNITILFEIIFSYNPAVPSGFNCRYG